MAQPLHSRLITVASKVKPLFSAVANVSQPTINANSGALGGILPDVSGFCKRPAEIFLIAGGRFRAAIFGRGIALSENSARLGIDNFEFRPV